MGDDFLTFDELRKVQSKERNKDTLQHLDSGFFNRARNYLQMKKDNGSYVENKEYRNAKNILEDIIHRRQKKVVKLAVLSSKTNVKVDNLLPGEQQLFNSVEGLIDSYRDELYEQLFDDEAPDNISAPTVSGGSAELSETEDELLDDDIDTDLDDDLPDTDESNEDAEESEEDDNPFSVAEEPEKDAEPEETDEDTASQEETADEEEKEPSEAEEASDTDSDSDAVEDDETADAEDTEDGSEEADEIEEVDEYADEDDEDEGMSAEEADALLDVDDDETEDESSEEEEIEEEASSMDAASQEEEAAEGEDLSTDGVEETTAAEDDEMQAEQETESSEEGITIEITEEVPEFMGVDLEAYGPFEEGDTATVPEENANVLLSQGKAEEA